MGFLAFGIVLILALAIGFAVQFYTKTALRYEWLVIALAFAFGAYFASETVPGSTVPVLDAITNWGPEFDGMLVIPAIVGAVLLAIVTYFGVHTGEYARTA